MVSCWFNELLSVCVVILVYSVFTANVDRHFVF